MATNSDCPSIVESMKLAQFTVCDPDTRGADSREDCAAAVFGRQWGIARAPSSDSKYLPSLEQGERIRVLTKPWASSHLQAV
jgi:hypothetical protein